MSELEEQIREQIAAVEGSLTHVDEVFGNLNSVEYDEVVKNMSALDRAKYDLTNLYAINSLFWMYTRSFGEDPKTLPIKEELDRIKQQMMRVKQIGDKSKMPRVDKEVAQRMIKHGLKHSNKQSKEMQEEDWDKCENIPGAEVASSTSAGSSAQTLEEPMETDNNKVRGQKRKFPANEEETTGGDEGGDDKESSQSITPAAAESRTEEDESIRSNSDDEYQSAQEN